MFCFIIKGLTVDIFFSPICLIYLHFHELRKNANFAISTDRAIWAVKLVYMYVHFVSAQYCALSVDSCSQLHLILILILDISMTLKKEKHKLYVRPFSVLDFSDILVFIVCWPWANYRAKNGDLGFFVISNILHVWFYNREIGVLLFCTVYCRCWNGGKTDAISNLHNLEIRFTWIHVHCLLQPCPIMRHAFCSKLYLISSLYEHEKHNLKIIIVIRW